jgi:fructose-1,6-bisphosphatase
MLLQHSLQQDLSKYHMLDVGWFDTQLHWMHSKSSDAELMARALSISR